jgi:polycomb protein EED
MRFSLYNPLSACQGHPVLAIANSSSKVHFWDFGRLQQWHEYRASNLSIPRPSWLNRGRPGVYQGLGRAARAPSVGSSISTLSTEQLNSMTDATSVATGADTEMMMAQLDEGSRRKYDIDDPNAKIMAHKVENIRTHSFTGRQVAWSPGGDWCVVVGSADVVAVLERWGTK